MCRYRPTWSNRDLQATNTTVEMDCAPAGHVTWNSKHINHLNRSLECNSSVAYAVITRSVLSIRYGIRHCTRVKRL